MSVYKPSRPHPLCYDPPCTGCWSAFNHFRFIPIELRLLWTSFLPTPVMTSATQRQLQQSKCCTVCRRRRFISGRSECICKLFSTPGERCVNSFNSLTIYKRWHQRNNPRQMSPAVQSDFDPHNLRKYTLGSHTAMDGYDAKLRSIWRIPGRKTWPNDCLLFWLFSQTWLGLGQASWECARRADIILTPMMDRKRARPPVVFRFESASAEFNWLRATGSRFLEGSISGWFGGGDSVWIVSDGRDEMVRRAAKLFYDAFTTQISDHWISLVSCSNYFSFFTHVCVNLAGKRGLILSSYWSRTNFPIYSIEAKIQAHFISTTVKNSKW